MQNSISETEIVQQARDSLDWSIEDDTNVIAACEAFYLCGFSDAVSGDVESHTGHFYRVHRWIVVTDSQGFHELQTFDNEKEAIEAFDSLDNEFGDWMDG